MTPEEITQKISDKTMSPYCPGLTLSGCPSEDAINLRTEILKELKSGKSESDVEQILYQRFGSKISGLPVSDNIFWATPIILILFLLILFTKIFKKPRNKHV